MTVFLCRIRFIDSTVILYDHLPQFLLPDEKSTCSQYTIGILYCAVHHGIDGISDGPVNMHCKMGITHV